MSRNSFQPSREPCRAGVRSCRHRGIGGMAASLVLVVGTGMSLGAVDPTTAYACPKSGCPPVTSFTYPVISTSYSQTAAGDTIRVGGNSFTTDERVSIAITGITASGAGTTLESVTVVAHATPACGRYASVCGGFFTYTSPPLLVDACRSYPGGYQVVAVDASGRRATASRPWCAQDVSPTPATYTINDPGYHSTSGRIITVAMAPDGHRAYAAAYSGVWRSDDGGADWYQLTRPQPAPGVNSVPGAIGTANIYDVVVSQEDDNLVLAAAADDVRVHPQTGIYRSTDGGHDWVLVHQFVCEGVIGQSVGQIVFAPDNPDLVYAAGGCAVGVSTDGGATWTDHNVASIGGTAWHIAVAPQDVHGLRRVYADGNNWLGYSPDGGSTWYTDAGVSIILASGLTAFGQYGCDISKTCFAGGTSNSDVLAVEPGHPDHVYLAATGGANGPDLADGGTNCNTAGSHCNEGSLWMGDFSQFSPDSPRAGWRQAGGPPVFHDVTDSGAVYVDVKPTTSGYLVFFADESHTYVAQVGDGMEGPPSGASWWHRLDGPDPSVMALGDPSDPMKADNEFMHFDQHAMAVSGDFDLSLSRPWWAPFLPFPWNQSSMASFKSGTILLGNDGGIWRSTDGGASWKVGSGLSTLPPLNVAGMALPSRAPALYIGMGDNGDFYSLDGGSSWASPVSASCGDCDWFWADPANASWVLETSRTFGLYTNSAGGYPDGSVPGGGATTHVSLALPMKHTSNFGAFYSNLGNRMLIDTPAAETPPADGDVLVILHTSSGSHILGRTTNISTFTDASDWASSKLAEVGPVLPSSAIDVVQASGGHVAPTYYVGDPDGSKGLWKWTAGMSEWQPIVPSPTATEAIRFFADPYDPRVIYIIDQNAIKRSDDGGATWHVDTNLDAATTEGGAFAYNGGADGRDSDAVIRDMIFSSTHPGVRFAIGNAGVFYTYDGTTWQRALDSTAMPCRPVAGYLDENDPSAPDLYVATDGRGLLKIGLPAFSQPSGGLHRGGYVTGPAH